MTELKARPRVIDLFAGVGGLSLGAVRAGFDLALAVDADAEPLRAHERNFPKCRHLLGDISLLSGDRLLELGQCKSGDLDGLIGGPPCQGFSVIGNQSTTDPRNSLFVKFFELAAETRPRFFVAENVLGLLHPRFEDARETALRLVRNDYELLPPVRIKANEFGAATSRERVFFIGHRLDSQQKLTREDIKPDESYPKTTVGEALQGLPVRIRSTWLTEQQSWRQVKSVPDTPYWHNYTAKVPPGVGDPDALRRFREQSLASGCFGTRHSSTVKERYNRLQPGQQDPTTKSVRLRMDGFCPTLRAGTGPDKGSFQAVRPIHPTAPRVITPREAARLQGFPDWFRFAPTKWHSFRQIGNSVSPIVSEAVLRAIFDRL